MDPLKNLDVQSFYTHLLQKAHDEYETSREHFPTVESLEYILSPFVVELPQKAFDLAAQVVRDFWALSRSQNYQDALPPAHKEWLNLPNASVLMAYDFHLVNGDELRLIEINTNASGFLISNLLATSDDDARRNLFQSFQLEWQSVFPDRPLEGVIVTDQHLAQQKMKAEHFMYQDFFRSQGLRSIVAEWDQFDITGLIYNRHTDFYLENADAERLREAALEREICLTPSPKEYLLLADKRRLLELQASPKGLSPALQQVLLKSFRLQDLTKTEAWEQRKKYVLKPVQSYGGKAVYRGQSITKKVFDKVWNENFLAQEYAPAAPLAGTDFRFDLRFYAYQDRIQLQVARVYNGQITNFKTRFGGFARIKTVSN
jgi:hypothetical protein